VTAPEKLALGLPRSAAVEGDTLYVTREGAPGSGRLDHEHADASNTRVSRDKLVRRPLGVLWFGGPSHDGILPHGHGPQPQVIDGRLLIEGVDMLRAWTFTPAVCCGRPGCPALAVLQQPRPSARANAAGTSFISMSDGIYVVHGNRCVRLDPATGKQWPSFACLRCRGKSPPRWGYINVIGDLLIGGAIRCSTKSSRSSWPR
jgi:hypothetical protein